MHLIKIILRATLFVAMAGLLLGGALTKKNETGREIRERADQAMRAENWTEADKIIVHGLQENPASAELWVGRGFTRNRLGKPDEARQSFQNALRLYRAELNRQPDHPGWILNVGLLLILLDSSEEATRFLTEQSQRLPHVEPLADVPGLVTTVEKNFSEWILRTPAEE